MNPIDVLCILQPTLASVAEIPYFPIHLYCVFCASVDTLQFVPVHGRRRRKRKGIYANSMQWEILLCRACRKQCRRKEFSYSTLVWLTTLHPEDVRLMWAKGYFLWAYYYFLYSKEPIFLTSLYDPKKKLLF